MKTLLAACSLVLILAGCMSGPSSDEAASQHQAASEKCGCKAVCANCACSHCGSKSEKCPCGAHVKDGCACVCKGGGTTNCLCVSCSTGKGGCACPK